MTELCLITERIENTIMKVCDFVDSQQTTGSCWKNLCEEELWPELVSCILGSRVRYETAKACSIQLLKTGLLDISTILKNPKRVEKAITKELGRPMYPPMKGRLGSR